MRPRPCIVLFATKSKVAPPNSEATLTFSHAKYKELYMEFAEEEREKRLSHASSKDCPFGTSKLNVIYEDVSAEITFNKNRAAEGWKKLVPFYRQSECDTEEIEPEDFKRLLKISEEDWTAAWKSATAMREPKVSLVRKDQDERYKAVRRYIKAGEKIPKSGDKKDGKKGERRKRKVRNETSKKKRDKLRKRKQKEEEDGNRRDDEKRKRRRQRRRELSKKYEEEEERRREWERERRRRDRERRRSSKEPKVHRRRLPMPGAIRYYRDR